jgi:hypothetical protein
MQVLQLMYNLLLAGDGLSTVGSKWQSKYNEAVDPYDDSTMDMFADDPHDTELDRMRELAGMSPADGMQSGGVSKEDFKEMFWEYWDKSSPSSQYQYLSTVYGDNADLDDFSDAAAQSIDHIVNCQDEGACNKQLHLLSRIGMPLYSICPATGTFMPS